VRAQEIAERTGVPRPYLSKILHALGQHGLILTKRGYQGGFALSAPATKISLLDVAEAVEGSEWAPKCVLGLAKCSDARACPMHEYWKREQQRIADKLSKVTLREMAHFEQRAGSVRPARASDIARRASVERKGRSS
jgi:Rrf2 family protein